MSDPKLPPGTNYCKCAACGEYFNSVYSFDMHRKYGECLSVPAMNGKGMQINARGYWISRARQPVTHDLQK